MYNSKSRIATEFIDDAEIKRTLAWAEENKNDLEMIRGLLERAKDCKGLTYQEAMLLLECDDPQIHQEIFKLANEIKEKFYGNRIVMFAPLYLSNYCVNGCLLPLPRPEQNNQKKETDSGRNRSGSYGAAGYGPQTSGSGSR